MTEGSGSSTRSSPGRRRIWVAAEIVCRLVLIALALNVLPRVFNGDVRHFYQQANRYSLTHAAHAPYRYIPRYEHAYEFPPFTVVFLAMQRLSSHNFQVFRWMFGVVMASFEFGTLILLRRSWPHLRRRLNAMWYASVVPMALLAWFRYDFVAVFFAALALVAMEKGRRGGSWAIVAGFGMKLWPAVLIPCAVVRRRWREAVTALAGCGAVLLGWYLFSPSGFGRFLQYRQGSGLEIESLPASLRLLGHHSRFRLRSGAWVIEAGQFGWVGTVLTGALVAFAAYAIVRAWRSSSVDVVALAGALTLASFLLSRIISAQYLVWIAPFVAVLWARGNRRVGWLSIATTACTVVYLAGFDGPLLNGNRLVAGFVVARNALLLVLLVELTRAIRGTTQPVARAGDMINPPEGTAADRGGFGGR